MEQTEKKNNYILQEGKTDSKIQQITVFDDILLQCESERRWRNVSGEYVAAVHIVCGCTCMYTVGISPSFVTVSVMFLALALRSLTTLSMVAWCFKKNGRITRLYKTAEPFHVTGAMHHIRNKHWGGEQTADLTYYTAVSGSLSYAIKKKNQLYMGFRVLVGKTSYLMTAPWV